MNRTRGHGLAIGLLLSLTAVSVAMTAITLAGFGSSTGGDAAVSASGSPLNLALIAVGALAMVGLEFWHIASRRPVAPRFGHADPARV
jgi:hypothetical protein